METPVREPSRLEGQTAGLVGGEMLKLAVERKRRVDVEVWAGGLWAVGD